jgi:hypothetical protein
MFDNLRPIDVVALEFALLAIPSMPATKIHSCMYLKVFDMSIAAVCHLISSHNAAVEQVQSTAKLLNLGPAAGLWSSDVTLPDGNSTTSQFQLQSMVHK